MKENVMFQTNDLFQAKNMSNVLDNLRALRELTREGKVGQYFIESSPKEI